MFTSTSIAVVGGMILVKEIIQFAFELYKIWTLDVKVDKAEKFLMQFDRNQNNRLSKSELQYALDSLKGQNYAEVIDFKCLILFIIQAKMKGYSDLRSNIWNYYSTNKDGIKKKLEFNLKTFGKCVETIENCQDIADILQGIFDYLLGPGNYDILSSIF